MGHWERNLIIFGTAGVLALAGVFIAGLTAGLVWTFFVLGVAMFLALGRYGPDKVTLEEWLIRRWRYARAVKRYTYTPPPKAAARPNVQPQPAPRAKPAPAPASVSLRPITWAEDRTAYYWAFAVLAVVGGTVFVMWLQTGGAVMLTNQVLQILGR